MVLSVTVQLNVSNPLRKTSASLPLESRHAVLARVLACTSSASSLSCFFKEWAWSWVFKQPKKLCGKSTRLLRLGIPTGRPVTLHWVSACLPLFSRLWWIKGSSHVGLFFIFYTWCKLLFLTLFKFADSNRSGLWKAWQETVQGKAVFCGAAPLQVLCEP